MKLICLTLFLLALIIFRKQLKTQWLFSALILVLFVLPESLRENFPGAIIGADFLILALFVLTLFKPTRLFLAIKTGLGKNILLYFLVAAIAMVLTIWNGGGIKALSNFFHQFAYLSLYFSAVVLIDRQALIGRSIKLILAAGSIAVLYGLLQTFLGYPVIDLMTNGLKYFGCYIYPHEAIQQQIWWGMIRRPFSFFFSPNAFAAVTMLLIPLFLVTFIKEKNPWWRGGWWAALMLTFLSVILTYARSAQIGLLVIFVLFFFYSWQSNKKWWMLLAAIFFILTLVLPSLILNLSLPPVKATYFNQVKDMTLEMKLVELRRVGEIIRKHPLLGIGFLNSFPGMLVSSAYLQVLVELGIVGLACLMGIIWNLFRTIGAHDFFAERYLWLNGLRLSLVAACVHSAFDHSFLSVAAAVALSWLFAGLAVAAKRVAEND